MTNTIQEQTKKCPKCQTEIPKKATVCPNCKSDLRNWFSRHTILTVVLIIIFIIIIIGGKKENSPDNSININTKKEVLEKKKITKENCNAIKSEMTNEQVKNILGEPSSTTESETAGIGKSEMWQFQESFSTKACSIVFMNGKVYSKTWIDL